MPPLFASSDAMRADFIRDGFIRIDNAFSAEIASAAREILWRDSGCDPKRPATWTRPVVRLGFYADEPFLVALNTPRLHRAYDLLAGAGQWMPLAAVGTFPIRFPSPDDPGDAGWHVDVSFGHDKADFMDWRANVTSRGRALLLIALFSDVGPADAPTRLRVGSHHSIARRLVPAGAAGLTLRELAATDFAESADCREAWATGPAGTVYACHPFLVHSAQPHRGRAPRFIAQPALLPRGAVAFGKSEDGSAMGEAIRAALAAG
ncbi:MAG TPA: phytanoyl-CoA dioxygenase [Kaistia sp.]|nr:phytanoyl-CoA dioxygenase [Kaistia sp.]